MARAFGQWSAGVEYIGQGKMKFSGVPPQVDQASKVLNSDA